jgi:hypothetical protein
MNEYRRVLGVFVGFWVVFRGILGGFTGLGLGENWGGGRRADEVMVPCQAAGRRGRVGVVALGPGGHAWGETWREVARQEGRVAV